MKTNHLFLLPLATLCLILYACSSEEDPSFSFASTLYDTDESTITLDLYGDEGSEQSLTFYSAREWTAAVDCDWLTVSPTSGDAGTCSVTLTNADCNDTSDTRTATLSLTSVGLVESISITQDPTVTLESDTVSVDPEGTDELYLYFSLNVNNLDSLLIYYGPTSMFNASISANTAATNDPSTTSLTTLELIQNGAISPVAADLTNITLATTTDTRSSARYYVGPISVLANTSAATRYGYFYFYFGNPYANMDCTLLATIFIEQEGSGTAGTSTDYSADGTVVTLQTASIGSGIPIVLMGDGFLDTDIADGTYDEVMTVAMENLFTEEPMTSLRDYFSVYAVQVVSASNVFGTEGYSTALGCVLEGGASTYVEGEDDTVWAYMNEVEGIDASNALGIVILNCNDYAGTTFFRYTIGNSVTELAIAYCPIIYGLDSEYFREVLVHESVGHGFAKLADEYAYSGTIPSSEITTAQSMQNSYGWLMNVDFTSDTSSVLWAKFLADDTYTGEELGVYEGAYTYAYGAYRPTYESMMNSNQVGFNAPSRQEIYNRVIEEYTGSEPSYDEFVTFDVSIGTAGKALTTSSAVRRATAKGVVALKPHPPVATGKTLK